MSELGTYLEAILQRQGLTIPSFARKCGIAKESARRLLAGIGTPRDDTLARVAERLPAPLRELRRLAGLDADPPRPLQLPGAFELLSESNRKLLVTIGWKLLASQNARASSPPDEVEDDRDAHARVPRIGPVARPDGRQRVTRAAHRRPGETD